LIFIDQIEHTFLLENKPSRIVSLVPSQTELLAYLGLDETIVGITKFCIHPSYIFKSKTRVGGTKKINFETIDKLQPDLIIANKEENTKEDILKLQKKYAVYTSQIETLNDSLKMTSDIGEITMSQEKANKLISEIALNFDKLSSDFKTKQKVKVAYLIWKNPYMTVNKNTFIHHMLAANNFINCFEKHIERYPVITINDLIEQSPDAILLSSEPYPFKEKDIEEIKKQLPTTKIILVNGEFYSWYGSKLKSSPKYFKQVYSQLNSIS
jgi:iron complex transport system substrate-binding protein